MVVDVVSVFLVAVPFGVSIVVFDVVVVVSDLGVLSVDGFDASTVTLVEGPEAVVVGGALGSLTIVVLDGDGSFTTVVDVEAGRSQPAKAAIVTTTTAGMSRFI